MYKNEEINYPSTTKNGDKTFSFGFYEPKHKNSVNLNFKIVTEKNKNIVAKNELTKNNKKLNVNNDNKKDKDKEISDFKNGNKKYEKKKYMTHLKKNKSDNFSNIINSSRFPKVIKEFKKNVEKSGILNKNRNKNKNKRSLSQELIKIKIYKLDEEDINKVIKAKKRSNSHDAKNILNIKRAKEKKDKIGKENNVKYSNTINNINENKRTYTSKKIERKVNKTNNINDNLNINKILSEKRNRKYTNTKMGENIISKIGEKPLNKHKKNINMSQDILYDKSYMNTSINTGIKKENKKVKNKINETITIENNNAQNLKKNNGRKLFIKRNKYKTVRKSSIDINDNNGNRNNINKTSRNNHKPMQTTPVKMIEKPKRSKDLKSSIFTHRSNKTSFFQTRRNKRNNNLLDKNISTNDSSDKKQINLNENKANRFKTIKSDTIKLTNALRKIVKRNSDKNDNHEKVEIKTKKNENLIKNVIDDCVGRNNITISNLDKNHFRFACKMYIDKKKVVFNLNLILEEKSKNIITGEFVEGDIQKYEKIFGNIREKLE